LAVVKEDVVLKIEDDDIPLLINALKQDIHSEIVSFGGKVEGAIA